MAHTTGRTRLDGSGHQVVDVLVKDGYQPNTIEARAGVPMRLVFRRPDQDPCSERVIFSDPRLERLLAADGPTEILLPPRGPGRVRFTCAMGRYRGEIIVRPEARWTGIPALLAWTIGCLGAARRSRRAPETQPTNQPGPLPSHQEMRR